MCKTKRKRFTHPHLVTDGTHLFRKDECGSAKIWSIQSSRHHLYPVARNSVTGCNKHYFILRMWEYKHFKGWNHLFQYYYVQYGRRIYSELTIDEILTLMSIRHPFITDNVGSPAWKILFKEKTIEEAFELLDRVLSVKFNLRWTFHFPATIKMVVTKVA